jgi:hypothetical protein
MIPSIMGEVWNIGEKGRAATGEAARLGPTCRRVMCTVKYSFRDSPTSSHSRRCERFADIRSTDCYAAHDEGSFAALLRHISISSCRCETGI